jgi:hypothetical protein
MPLETRFASSRRLVWVVIVIAMSGSFLDC